MKKIHNSIMMVLFLLTFASLLNKIISGISVADLMKNYLQSRDQIFHLEKKYHLGSNIQLNENELKANNYLMAYKLRELDEAMLSGDFGPAKSFYLSKPDIESTEVFRFIKKMPKGAALHTHHISLGSINWIITNLTYWDNLFMRYDNTFDTLEFAWFQKPPGVISGTNLILLGNLEKYLYKELIDILSEDSTKWQNINEARRIFGRKPVDKFLTRYLSCGIDTIKVQDININKIWQTFKKSVIAIHGIIFYLPAFNAYIYNALEEMLADNVQHVQIRTSLPTICTRMKDMGCEPLSKYEAAKAYLEVSDGPKL